MNVLKAYVDNLKTFINPQRMMGDLHEKLEQQDLRIKKLRYDYKKEADWRIKYAAALGALTDSMQAMVWQKDKDHRYILANKIHCVNFLGFSSDQICMESILGKTDLELINQLYISRGEENTFGKLCTFTDNYAEKNGSVSHFIEAGSINGESILLYVVKSPEFDRRKNYIGSLGMGWDFTSQSEFMVEQLNRWIYSNKVEKVYKDKDVFAYALEPSIRRCDIFNHVCPNPERDVVCGVTCDKCEKGVRVND